MSNVQDLATAKPEKAKMLLKSYIFGFTLTLISVLLAYWFVQSEIFTGKPLFFALAVIAIAQFLIQVIFYMRLNDNKDDEKWSSRTLNFTLIILAIIISGNLWILYNLNYNMHM
ncbi:MAG: cytochrome o ubiquinol oxidase operon protein cyoD [Francisellaceae bacterium]|jgi:cytochrome o ubiquinol oxidase operon protein cyoD